MDLPLIVEADFLQEDDEAPPVYPPVPRWLTANVDRRDPVFAFSDILFRQTFGFSKSTYYFIESSSTSLKDSVAE